MTNIAKRSCPSYYWFHILTLLYLDKWNTEIPRKDVCRHKQWHQKQTCNSFAYLCNRGAILDKGVIGIGLNPCFTSQNSKRMLLLFVQECDVCQRSKPKHLSYPGFLQPIPIPQQAWSYISMDFIEKHPKSQGYDMILVVIDKFTKFGHFLLLTYPFTARQVA